MARARGKVFPLRGGIVGTLDQDFWPRWISLNAALLGRAAPVVRNRSYIRNTGDLESNGVEGTHRGLAARPGSLDPNLQILETSILCRAAGLFCRDLSRKRRTLTRAFESARTGRCPGQCIALTVGDHNDRIVEGRVNVSDSFRHVLLDLLSHPGRCGADAPVHAGLSAVARPPVRV